MLESKVSFIYTNKQTGKMAN